MLVGQTAGVGREECWSVKHVCCSVKTAEVGMQVLGMLIG